MRVTIFGSGYVGLVTGACLADAGNDVVCVDVDAAKIARINAGDIPIHEPGLAELIARNRKKGRLRFTTDSKAAVAHGLFQIIAVGTPPDEDGSADLSHVLAVARTIGRNLTRYAVVVDKSTAPVGTADRVRAAIVIASTLKHSPQQIAFDEVGRPLLDAPGLLREQRLVADDRPGRRGNRGYDAVQVVLHRTGAAAQGGDKDRHQQDQQRHAHVRRVRPRHGDWDNRDRDADLGDVLAVTAIAGMGRAVRRCTSCRGRATCAWVASSWSAAPTGSWRGTIWRSSWSVGCRAPPCRRGPT